MAPSRLFTLLPLALGGLLLSTAPVVGLSLDDVQALNRELGRLCNAPPRLVRAL